MIRAIPINIHVIQAVAEVFGGSRFPALKKSGAYVQRPLWASMSMKDSAYPDLYYIEALVAPDSVPSTDPPRKGSTR
jgi:hypothetical protein